MAKKLLTLIVFTAILVGCKQAQQPDAGEMQLLF